MARGADDERARTATGAAGSTDAAAGQREGSAETGDRASSDSDSAAIDAGADPRDTRAAACDSGPTAVNASANAGDTRACDSDSATIDTSANSRDSRAHDSDSASVHASASARDSRASGASAGHDAACNARTTPERSNSATGDTRPAGSIYTRANYATTRTAPRRTGPVFHTAKTRRALDEHSRDAVRANSKVAGASRDLGNARA